MKYLQDGRGGGLKGGLRGTWMVPGMGVGDGGR